MDFPLPTVLATHSGKDAMPSLPETGSPHDSLSPQDEDFRHVKSLFPSAAQEYQPTRGWKSSEKKAVTDSGPSQQAVHTPGLPTTGYNDDPNEAAQASSAQRAQPPASLRLARTNGFTQVPTDELRRQIYESRADSQTNVAQVPRVVQDNLPATPTTPMAMGKQPSGPESNAAARMQRPSQTSLRKRSFNPFRRAESKAPRSQDAASRAPPFFHPSRSAANAREAPPADPSFDPSPAPPSRDANAHQRFHSASTVTMTDERAAAPLSASSTIRGSHLPLQSSGEVAHVDGTNDNNIRTSERTCVYYEDSRFAMDEHLAMPGQFPLSQDSLHRFSGPHSIENMEPAALPNEIRVPRTWPRGFDGASTREQQQMQQTLSSNPHAIRPHPHEHSILSASSHNTASQTPAESTTTLLATLREPSPSPVPDSTPPPSSSNSTSSQAPGSRGSSSSINGGGGRHLSPNFKTSGFARARPLTLPQIKCYRAHAHLLASGNERAPVECAVCHADDPADHWSCSWCALRMCDSCRAALAARGVAGLHERLAMAEGSRRALLRAGGESL